jgi:hypothetical protein
LCLNIGILILKFSNSRSTDEPKPSFFRFPARNREQREAWLSVVGRKNADMTDWVPRAGDRICSHHFESGAYSTRRDRVNYIPTLNVGPGPIPTFNFPVPSMTPDLDIGKGKFFSDNIPLCVRLPILVNILLYLNILQYIAEPTLLESYCCCCFLFCKINARPRSPWGPSQP